MSIGQRPPAVARSGDRLLDRYRLADPVASGGASLIFRAVDERLHRTVCVKVFARPASGTGIWKTAYEHFVQEAFSLSLLTHPHTVRIYDFGYLGAADADDAHPFQVLEYLEGGTLWDAVGRNGPLSPAEVAGVVAGLAGALEEAHQQGIVHRDLKPTNILFCGGTAPLAAKLIDFGIAKALRGGAGAASAVHHAADDTEIVAGTRIGMYSPNWSAPEQFLGLPVDRSADIYSLALVIAFMLTGKAVMDGNRDAGVLEARRQVNVLLDRALAGCDDPTMVTTVGPLLKRACAFDPRSRPTEIARFSCEVISRLTGVPVGGGRRRLARGTTEPPQLQPDPRRAPAPLAQVAPVAAAAPVAPVAPLAPVAPVSVEREVTLVELGPLGARLPCGEQAQLRLCLLPGGRDRVVLHIKGVDCFVARAGARASSAVQADDDTRIEVSSARGHSIASLELLFGRSTGDATVVSIDGRTIELAGVRFAAALDYGASGPCFVLHSPGGAAPTSRPIWKKD